MSVRQNTGAAWAHLSASARATTSEGLPIRYVASDGNAGTAGSYQHPWSWAYALERDDLSGFIVELMDDGPFEGNFDINYGGTDGVWAPGYDTPGNQYSVVFRAAPGTRPVIDGHLGIWGDYVLAQWLEGIQTGWADAPTSFEADTFTLKGYHSTLRHCLAHQATSNTIGYWAETAGADLYGNITLNSGLTDDPLGGHLIYGQNFAGETKQIRQHAFGHCNGFGAHLYTETSGKINDFLLEACAAWGQGATGGGQHPAYLSGNRSRSNHTYRRAYSYGSPSSLALAEQFGATKTGLTIEDCDLTAAEIMAGESEWADPVTISGNVIEGNSGITARLAAGSTVYAYGAGPDRHYIEPDEFEPGRALVVIRNPSEASTVPIDLSSVLDEGDTFAVFDTLNPLAGPCLDGTYSGGTIPVPMTGHTCEAPLDPSKITPTHPAPQYGQFVVLKGRTEFVAP